MPKHWFLFLLVPGLLGSSGCSVFNWKSESTSTEPGIVILERKASPDIQGFNVFRKDPEDGTESMVNSRLVEPASDIRDDRGLVPYRIIDRGVIAGTDYYYIFEEVAKDGTKTRWETPQLMTAQPLSAAGSDR